MTHSLHRRQSGISGIGLLVFAVLVLVSLYWILRPGGHPLALERNVPLCARLGDDLWASLVPPGTAVVARQEVAENPSVCLLERQEPASPSANPESQMVARIMLTTEADVRHGGPGRSFGRYIDTFVEEMAASGWTRLEATGPWRRTYAFSGTDGETVVMIDDEGVFLWISSHEYPAERLLAFAGTVTARLREEPAETH